MVLSRHRNDFRSTQSSRLTSLHPTRARSSSSGGSSGTWLAAAAFRQLRGLPRGRLGRGHRVPRTRNLHPSRARISSSAGSSEICPFPSATRHRRRLSREQLHECCAKMIGNAMAGAEFVTARARRLRVFPTFSPGIGRPPPGINLHQKSAPAWGWQCALPLRGPPDHSLFHPPKLCNG